LFMFNIGNVISKNPVFPEHTSCITHICIYKFHRKTFEKWKLWQQYVFFFYSIQV
jgi:hypothetical protein